MTKDRITIYKNRRPTPTGFDLKFSSWKSQWAGFRIEEHLSPQAGFEKHWEYPKTHIILNNDGGCEFNYIESKTQGNIKTFLGKNSISIIPKGYDFSFKWNGFLQFFVVELDPQILNSLVGPDERTSDHGLVPRHGLDDPHLFNLMKCIEMESKAGNPSGKLYSECLSLTLNAYVTSRYSSDNPSSEEQVVSCRRLSPAQREKILEYIHSNIHKNLSLTELAEQLGLSPHYFCSIFKDTFGMPPHKFVLHQRINIAKRMLSEQDVDIAETAANVGFSSQSHFTNVFHKITGITPKRYRYDA